MFKKHILSLGIIMTIIICSNQSYGVTTPGAACGTDKVYDCAGACVEQATIQSWTGDGVCDDGEYGVTLTCDELNNDGGDCGSDSGGGGGTTAGTSCGTGKVYDCAGNCVDQWKTVDWVGDGTCDDGEYGAVFTCDTFNNDGGDCGDSGGGGGETTAGTSCGTGKVYDCAGICVDQAKAQSWTGDGVCDDGQYGMTLTCDAFNNDGNDCGGSDGGGGETTAGASCGTGKVYDCAGECVDQAKAQSWTGDGVCDDGQYGMTLTCDAFNNDGNDCGSGGGGSEQTPGTSCATGKVYDCAGNCVEIWQTDDWVGDGSCDDGEYGVDFTCETFSNDGGDCEDASGTVIFESNNYTSWNYFTSSFGSTFSSCGEGGWEKVMNNLKIKVSILETSSDVTQGESFIEIKISRISNIYFSDGDLGYALPEAIDVDYKNVKVIFVDSSGDNDVSDNYSTCGETIFSTIVDLAVGAIPLVGDVYGFLMGFKNTIENCTGSSPLKTPSFLDKNGHDQSFVKYEDPAYLLTVGGTEIRVVIPVINKTASEVVNIISQESMAIFGSIYCDNTDNLGCQGEGRMIFGKEL